MRSPWTKQSVIDEETARAPTTVEGQRARAAGALFHIVHADGSFHPYYLDIWSNPSWLAIAFELKCEEAERLKSLGYVVKRDFASEHTLL